MLSVELKGAEELRKALAGLGGAGARRVARTAIRKGAKKTLAAAKANARTEVGGEMGSLIAKYIKIVPFSRQVARRVAGMSIMVSKDGNEHFVVGKNYIPAALEYGHVWPGAGGLKGVSAAVRPRAFMRPAWDSTKHQALQAILDAMRVGIEREAKRQAAKAKL